MTTRRPHARRVGESPIDYRKLARIVLILVLFAMVGLAWRSVPEPDLWGVTWR